MLLSLSGSFIGGGGTDPGAKLVASDDEGETWSVILEAGTGANFFGDVCVGRDADSGTIVVVDDAADSRRSLDNGATWSDPALLEGDEDVTAWFGGRSVESFGNGVFMAGGYGLSPFNLAGANDDGDHLYLARSTDGAQSWTRIELPKESEDGSTVLTTGLDPVIQVIRYLGENVALASGFASGPIIGFTETMPPFVWRTEDAGLTWVLLPQSAFFEPGPSTGDASLFFDCGDIVDLGHGVCVLGFGFRDGNHGEGDGRKKPQWRVSVDRGLTFPHETRMLLPRDGQGDGGSVRGLALADDGSVVSVGDRPSGASTITFEIWRGEVIVDYDVAWRKVDTRTTEDLEGGATAEVLHPVGVTLVEGTTMLVQDAHGRLFRSTDDGDTWTKIDPLPPELDDGDDDQRYRSPFSTGTGAVLASHTDASTDGQSVILRSTDAGDTWTKVWERTTGPVFADFIIGFFKRGTDLFAFGFLADPPSGAGDGWALLRSTDDGLTWDYFARFEDVTPGDNTAVCAAAVTETGRIVLLFDNTMTAAYSDDAGATWAIGGALPETYGGPLSSVIVRMLLALGGDRMIAGAEARNDGSFGQVPVLWYTTDGAVTWTQVNPKHIVAPQNGGDALVAAAVWCRRPDLPPPYDRKSLVAVGLGYGEDGTDQADLNDKPSWRAGRDHGVTYLLRTAFYPEVPAGQDSAIPWAMCLNSVGDIIAVGDRETIPNTHQAIYKGTVREIFLEWGRAYTTPVESVDGDGPDDRNGTIDGGGGFFSGLAAIGNEEMLAHYSEFGTLGTPLPLVGGFPVSPVRMFRSDDNGKPGSWVRLPGYVAHIDGEPAATGLTSPEPGRVLAVESSDPWDDVPRYSAETTLVARSPEGGGTSGWASGISEDDFNDFLGNPTPADEDSFWDMWGSVVLDAGEVWAYGRFGNSSGSRYYYLKSLDNGVTFPTAHDLSDLPDVGTGAHLTLVVYLGGDVLLAAVQYASQDNVALMRSDDRGASWTEISLPTAAQSGGPAPPYVLNSGVHLEDGVVVLVGGQADTGDAYVIRSTDYGLTWRFIELPRDFGGLLFGPYTIMSVAGSGSTVALGLKSTGFQRTVFPVRISMNGGQSFDLVGYIADWPTDDTGNLGDGIPQPATPMTIYQIAVAEDGIFTAVMDVETIPGFGEIWRASLLSGGLGPDHGALACDDELTEDDLIAFRWDSGDAQIINQVVAELDYDAEQGVYTKTLIYSDDVSIQRYGPRPPVRIQSQGLRSELFGEEFLDRRAREIFSRFGTPPAVLRVEVFYRKHAWEVGDVICFSSAHTPNLDISGRGLAGAPFEAVELRPQFATDGKVIATLLRIPLPISDNTIPLRDALEVSALP